MVLECEGSGTSLFLSYLSPAFGKPSLLSFYVVQGFSLSLSLVLSLLLKPRGPYKKPSFAPFFVLAAGAQDRLHSRKFWSLLPGSMESLSTTKRHLSILSRYLNQAEARDKICRTIQYGSKFVSGEYEGVAHQVDLSTGLARKVFRLLKSVDELEALVTPPSKKKQLPLVFLGKSKHSLMASYLALDNLVWAGRIGIYKNKQHTELISNISLYFFLGGCACSSLSELLQLVWKSEEKERTVSQEESRQQRYAHALSFVKSSMDVIVAIGLLQLAPNRVTHRVTGALGTLTSLITCYELFRATSAKDKTS